MRRIDTGVRQHGRANGLGRELSIVLGSVALVAIFVWWLGSLSFWHRQTVVTVEASMVHNAHADFPECVKEKSRVRFHNKHHGPGAHHLRLSYPCWYQHR